MAKFRHLYTEFWEDDFVMKLTPEEKFFYIYLLTNPKTTQCGIYYLPIPIAAVQTGYNEDTIKKLIERFVHYGKVQYDECTKEIMVQNWCKFNYNSSPKVQNCIRTELQKVKNPLFVGLYIEQVQKMGYSIDTVSVDYGEKEKEKEKKDIVQNAPSAPQSDAQVIPFQKPEKKQNVSKDKDDDDFKEFWELYPRREHRTEALKKFKTAMKKYGIDVILKGTHLYALEVKDRDKKYILLAKTFLNNEVFVEYAEKQESKESNFSGGEENWTSIQDSLKMKNNGSGLL